MKSALRILAGCYLGFSLSFFGNVHFFNWQYYAIIVPFFLVWVMSEEEDDEE